MKTFGIVWMENKSLSYGTIEAETPAQALDTFKTTKNPGGSYPVARSIQSEGKVHRVVKTDGRCMAVVTEIA